MSNLQTANIILRDDNFPAFTETIINQQVIEKDGNFIPFNRLAQLRVALDALQPIPPNANTVWFDNAILLQDASMAFASLNVNPTNFTFSDNNTYRIGDANGLSTLDMLGDNSLPANSFATLGSENLYFNFVSTCQFQSGSTFQVNIPNINLNSGNVITQIGDVYNTANATNLTIDDGAYRVNTNAIMMTAYNNSYILPICYTKKMTNTISYIGVNNTWQNVYQENMNAFPNEFFNPNNTFWDYKIEFSINMRNLSFPTDKGLALYFEILDGNSVVYTPFLYNQNTPFTRHSNNSTYTATSVDMLTFTWTDYITFNNSVVPTLTFSLWWYGDQNNAPSFEALLSLTRTNLV